MADKGNPTPAIATDKGVPTICYSNQEYLTQWLFEWVQGSTTARYYTIVIAAEGVLVLFHT